MKALSFLLSLILFGIAILHIIWGLGIWWPAMDETDLARAVVGAADITVMPDMLACFLVATALLCMAVLALILGRHAEFHALPGWMIVLAGFGASLIFLGRGLIGFTAFWMRLTPEEPFRTYDLWLYSPLCLVIGASLFALTRSFRHESS